MGSLIFDRHKTLISEKKQINHCGTVEDLSLQLLLELYFALELLILDDFL